VSWPPQGRARGSHRGSCGGVGAPGSGGWRHRPRSTASHARGLPQGGGSRQGRAREQADLDRQCCQARG